MLTDGAEKTDLSHAPSPDAPGATKVHVEQSQAGNGRQAGNGAQAANGAQGANGAQAGNGGQGPNGQGASGHQAGNGLDGIGNLPFKNNGQEKKEEDEELFAFFKKYIALLTAVGSLPLITSGMDVLSPPGAAEKKLSVISSLACIIVLGICILFKSTFASLSISSSKIFRAIPPFIAFVFLYLGIELIAQYEPAPESATVTVQRVYTYLAILPCFVASLGTILMASYSQFRGAQLVKTIDESFAGGEQIKSMRSMIQACAKIFGASSTLATEGFCRAIVKRAQSALDDLSSGYVLSTGGQIVEMQKLIFEHFKQSFHAVSAGELEFWMNCPQYQASHATLTAKEYLRLNTEAVKKKVTVTRIFIFEDNEYNNFADDVVSTLTKHHDSDLGWAVLWREELPVGLQEASATGFALLDGRRGLAKFVENRQRFCVAMNVPATEQWIEKHRSLHRSLVDQCWVASGRFCDAHRLDSVTLDQAIKDNKNKPHALEFGSGKVVRIDNVTDIARAMIFIRGLRRKNMVYYGEVRSRLLDIEGGWEYTVTNPDFAYRGTCEAIIENRGAHFLGCRTQISLEGEWQPINPPNPWKSSIIEFLDDGSLEYKTTISLDGNELPGIARLQFTTPAKNELKGGLNYIKGKGQASYADIQCTRRHGERSNGA